jgi:uncharacterized protein (TIGR02611 family)
MLLWTLRKARQLVVGVVGGTVVLIGVIMIVTPGPAVVMIPLGLAILATEFVWARTLLHHVKDRIKAMTSKNGKQKTEEQK